MALLNSLPFHCPFLPDQSKHSPQRILHPFRKIRRPRCVGCTQTSNPAAGRRSANYQPSSWSYDFVESLKNRNANKARSRTYTKKAKKLDELVRRMLDDEAAKPLPLLELIDDIHRLGMGYRFEKDIKRALDRIVTSEGFNAGTGKSLHAMALSFRLLRQHGYDEISQDMFKTFQDGDGKFMESLCEDVRGLLGLYEASHLAFEGENLLDEAKAFSAMHLKDLHGNSDARVAEHVSHALELPLHRRMLRLEARWYIEAYGERENADLVLLQLAKLDFNMVQSTLRQDLRAMSGWWKGLGLANKLSFARDRLMESFFWTVGMVFEPHFSNCRKGLTRVCALITVLDDVFDVYGSLDELELFTDAVKRWDSNAVENLPYYMKLCFLALYNTVNEMAYDTLLDQGENALPYLTKAWADLCNAFFVEAKWFYNKDAPRFPEYLDNAWRSASGVVILVHAYFLQCQKITEKELQCLENCHDLLRSESMIFRLCNDLVSSATELERGETVNAILCYMRETGVSEELARKHMANIIDESWKKMNKERVMNSPFAKPFIETAINLARIAHCMYQYGDGHSAPDTRSKNRVSAVIIEPFPLSE